VIDYYECSESVANKEERMTELSATIRRPARTWTNDVVTVAAAVVCALITWALATQLGGVALEVRDASGLRPVDGVSVAVVAALAALLGVLSLRLLERLTPKALPIWLGVATAVALFSLLGALAATSPAAVGTLMALHGVVAAVVIVGLGRSHRTRG
jgi:hypothetical protein